MGPADGDLPGPAASLQGRAGSGRVGPVGDKPGPSGPDRRGWRWLLAVPVVAPLLTPVYNRVQPEAFGVPFFYWYLLACVGLAVLVISVVYRLTNGRD
jgi:hypothetical protein